MVNEILSRNKFSVIFLAFLSLSLASLVLSLEGCTSGGKVSPSHRSPTQGSSQTMGQTGGARPPFSLASLAEGKFGLAPKSLVWTRKTIGAISGLSAAGQARAVLVATSPDPEIPGSSGYYFLSWYDSRGRAVWQKRMQSPVKDQDISEDGTFAVISNYADEVQGWDVRGKQLWSVPGMCRPRILNVTKRVLCYHDDDADPRVAFDLFDWKGNKVFSYSIDGDVLALKVNHDESAIAVGLTQGRVALFNGDRLQWQKPVDGEIVDVALSSQEVAVLSRVAQSNRPRLLTFYDLEGRMVQKVPLEFIPIQIEYAVDGQALNYYGNGQGGQFWGALTKPDYRELWQLSWPFQAEYSFQLATTQAWPLTASNRSSKLGSSEADPSVSERLTWVGFEETHALTDHGMGSTRRSHVLAFDSLGNLRKDIEVAPTRRQHQGRVSSVTASRSAALDEDEVAYIYSYKVVPSSGGAPGYVVIATDSAGLSLYSL